MGRLGFSVSVSVAGPSGKNSRVRVRSTLERFGMPGMELAASSAPGRAPHVNPSRLPDGLGWSVDDRLRHAGARKGRILAVWQGNTLVVVCTWHLHETGPPVRARAAALQFVPLRPRPKFWKGRWAVKRGF